MVTTKERIDVLYRARRRLTFLAHNRPFYRQTIKDQRIMIDALESLILIDPLKGEMKNADEKRS